MSTHTTQYRQGLTVLGLIDTLTRLPPHLQVLISNDEEQNHLYKGFYIQQYADAIVFAGLTGAELEEEQ